MAKKTNKDISSVLGQSAQFISDYAAVILDSRTTTKLVNDLGVDGKVIIKTVGGRQYIIFK